MTAEPSEPELYPQYCFHLSPTINRWCHFRAADIIRLTSHPGFQGQDIYFHLNHPIKWVRICGIVVDHREIAGRQIYTIDDSSGTAIDCVVNLPRSSQGPAPIVGTPEWNCKAREDAAGWKLASVDAPIDVGHILDVRGSVNVFRDQKQIIPDKIKHVRTTEQEALFWGKVAQLRSDVLDRPWVLDTKVVRKLRREEEGMQLRRHETGLEKHHTKRKRDAADLEDPAHPRRRNHETGLEPSNKRRDVGEKEKSLGARARNQQTGLEPAIKRSKGTAEKNLDNPDPRGFGTGLEPTTSIRRVEKHQVLLVARPRNPKTGLEPTGPETDAETVSETSGTHHGYREPKLGSMAKTDEVDEEGKPHRSHPRNTGFEKQGVKKNQEEVLESQYRIRVTGLEKKAPSDTKGEAAVVANLRGPEPVLKLQTTTAMKTDDSKPLTSRSRITELERQPLQSTQEDGWPSSLEGQNQWSQPNDKPSSRRQRLTGLERQNKLRREIDANADSQRHLPTGLESRRRRRLEEDEVRPQNHMERQAGVEARREKGKEGLTRLLSSRDRAAGLDRKGGQKSADSQSIEEDEDHGGQGNPDGWNINIGRKQVLVRGRTRTTGLERRVKTVTRVQPVTSRYDVTD
ncbi:hypothetical protein QBC42DRAFT_300834 [Cladorrhinum samala]|uniref:CST complex subunit Stn1 N-terminal domain-containing protein n=1 Tax=Cladorrhinum samala TaxID=585594 RepID=A0AAV9HAN1_9PEZI|nr:hypothetical protein QBC42DRAFT_300834 [Cladorrhinum samala]